MSALNSISYLKMRKSLIFLQGSLEEVATRLLSRSSISNGFKNVCNELFHSAKRDSPLPRAHHARALECTSPEYRLHISFVLSNVNRFPRSTSRCYHHVPCIAPQVALCFHVSLHPSPYLGLQMCKIAASHENERSDLTDTK